MRAGIVQGVALAAPEVAGLLLVALAPAGIWWWAHRPDRGWPRRTRLGGPTSTRPSLPVGPVLTVAAGVVLIVSALAAAWPGDAGPRTWSLIVVLVLAWLGAAAVCVAVSDRRARTARHRAQRAASTPLHRRGRAVDHLIIPEAHR